MPNISFIQRTKYLNKLLNIFEESFHSQVWKIQLHQLKAFNFVLERKMNSVFTAEEKEVINVIQLVSFIAYVIQSADVSPHDFRRKWPLVYIQEWIENNDTIYKPASLEENFELDVFLYEYRLVVHANKLDYNELTLMAFRMIDNPAYFTALIKYQLKKGMFGTDLIHSGLLQAFFEYHFEALGKSVNNPITFMHQYLATRAHSSLKDFSVLLANVPAITDERSPKQYTLAGGLWREGMVNALTPGKNWLNNMAIRQSDTSQYCACFGMDWMIPALMSKLSCGAVLNSLSVDFYQQELLSNINAIFHDAFELSLDAGKLILCRLASKLDPKLFESFCPEYPELIFLCMLQPNFVIKNISPTEFKSALKNLLSGPHPTNILHYFLLSKFLRDQASRIRWDTNEYAEWEQCCQIIIENVLAHHKFDIDFNRLQSDLLFSGLQQRTKMQLNIFSNVWIDKHIATFSDYKSLQEWCSDNPEKIKFLVYLFAGNEAINAKTREEVLQKIWKLYQVKKLSPDMLKNEGYLVGSAVNLLKRSIFQVPNNEQGVDEQTGVLSNVEKTLLSPVSSL